MPIISITAGPLAGQRFTLDREIVVGRGDQADLVIEDAELSRRHCAFRPRPDGGVDVEDLGSTNGTSAGGQRIVQPIALTVVTVVALGTTEITVEPDSAPAGVASGPASNYDETAVRAPQPQAPPAQPQQPGPAQPAFAAAETPPQYGPQGDFNVPAVRKRGVASRLPAVYILTSSTIGATCIALIIYFAQR